jgi:hypothetical protein
VLHPKYNIQAILLMLVDMFFQVQAITCLLCPRSTECPDPLVTNFQMKASGSQAMKKKLNHSYNVTTGILDFVLLVQAVKNTPPSHKTEQKQTNNTDSLCPKIIRVHLKLAPAPHKFVKKPLLLNISEKGVQIRSALKLCQNSIFSVPDVLGEKS